jgi:hypothetical protein
VEEDVRGASSVNDTEQLAWVVLLATNRTQARGSTDRLIFPRAPEVAEELGMELTDAQLLSAEEHLHERGYVAPANIGLSWGAYTITPAGFSWLEESSPGSSTTDRLRELAEKPGEEEAFEAALRAELEEERRQMEGVERELAEEPPRALETAVEKQERAEQLEQERAPLEAEPRQAEGEAERGKGFWARLFGG